MTFSEFPILTFYWWGFPECLHRIRSGPFDVPDYFIWVLWWYQGSYTDDYFIWFLWWYEGWYTRYRDYLCSLGNPPGSTQGFTWFGGFQGFIHIHFMFLCIWINVNVSVYLCIFVVLCLCSCVLPLGGSHGWEDLDLVHSDCIKPASPSNAQFGQIDSHSGEKQLNFLHFQTKQHLQDFKASSPCHNTKTFSGFPLQLRLLQRAGLSLWGIPFTFFVSTAVCW